MSSIQILKRHVQQLLKDWPIYKNETKVEHIKFIISELDLCLRIYLN